MLACQISNRLQVSLLWKSETVKRGDVTFVELVVFLEEEAFILVNAEIQFLFEVEDRVDPVAMIHVHRVDVARLNYVVVDLCSLAHNLHTLASVLVYDIVGGRVDNIALNLAQFLG